VAIVEGLIAGLCVLAVTPLLSLWMTDIGSIYLAYFLWGRSAVRLAIAALVYCYARGMCTGNPSEISEESCGGRAGRGPA
jgi:hypothetical protein